MLGWLTSASLQRVQEISLMDYTWQGVFVFLKVRLLPSPSPHSTMSPWVGPTFCHQGFLLPLYNIDAWCPSISFFELSLHFADTELIHFSSYFLGGYSFSSTHPSSVFPLSTSCCSEMSSPVEIASGTTIPHPALISSILLSSTLLLPPTRLPSISLPLVLIFLQGRLAGSSSCVLDTSTRCSFWNLKFNLSVSICQNLCLQINLSFANLKPSTGTTALFSPFIQKLGSHTQTITMWIQGVPP